MAAGRPTVVACGLGPAGPALVPPATRRALADAARRFVRTARHPALDPDGDGRCLADEVGPLESFDAVYDRADTFDEVYGQVTDALVAAAAEAAAAGGYVAYAVPGSPLVAERTVALLRRRRDVELRVELAPSFLDLAWRALGVDPLERAVRLVDAADFATEAAGQPGPLLVAQCHRRELLSAVKLAVDQPAAATGAVLLHHLGLPDEQVVAVDWEDIDRRLEPDHLTALWVERLAPPVAGELVALDELVRTLRERCPWDRRQTHGSLAPHLLEESYEALEAIDAVAAAEPDPSPDAVDHLEEELGDLLFQVVFHARLAAEAGRFTLADVARAVHHKLVGRHPHVFGEAAVDSAEEVAERWEVMKQAEKGRSSVFDGVPAALPALALAAKYLRRAGALAPGTAPVPALDGALARLDAKADAAAAGDALLAVVDRCSRDGVDAESALRAAAGRFRQAVEAAE